MRLIRVVVPFLLVAMSACGPGPRGGSSPESRADPHPQTTSEAPYFPPAGSWAHRSPEELGFDPVKLAEAVAFARAHETGWPRDFSTQERIFGKPLGPLPAVRAATNGLIIRHGYIAAEFGDTAAADPTYSCAKSYLSTILGLAVDRGLIPDITDPVSRLVHDEVGGGYASAQNAKVTWQHHATQTSEWDGELFGKASTFLGREGFGDGAMKPRELREPGSFYEYNDVRINRFSLSLLRVWKKPLPVVLRTEIMDPIGASHSWRWIPYDNATVDVDGVPMPSVSGGTRWGGGLWISALDHARFGVLFLRGGCWDGRRVISERWVAEATRPHPEVPGARGDYGYLWWLNTKSRWPDAPVSSFSAQGAGDNTLWVDPEHDLVVVWRWHQGDAQAEFYRRILAALR